MRDNVLRVVSRFVRDETLTPVERLARAVLLFHRGGPWSAKDRETWQWLTDSDEATTRTLCDLARRSVVFATKQEEDEMR